MTCHYIVGWLWQEGRSTVGELSQRWLYVYEKLLYAEAMILPWEMYTREGEEVRKNKNPGKSKREKNTECDNSIMLYKSHWGSHLRAHFAV